MVNRRLISIALPGLASSVPVPPANTETKDRGIRIRQASSERVLGEMRSLGFGSSGGRMTRPIACRHHDQAQYRRPSAGSPSDEPASHLPLIVPTGFSGPHEHLCDGRPSRIGRQAATVSAATIPG